VHVPACYQCASAVLFRRSQPVLPSAQLSQRLRPSAEAKTASSCTYCALCKAYIDQRFNYPLPSHRARAAGEAAFATW
jgi:hypothetical protein